jgi:hypothetical protein
MDKNRVQRQMKIKKGKRGNCDVMVLSFGYLGIMLVRYSIID